MRLLCCHSQHHNINRSVMKAPQSLHDENCPCANWYVATFLTLGRQLPQRTRGRTNFAETELTQKFIHISSA